ncbi:MAG TPA: hypothetical protein VIV63_12470 [Steroidobacteraceae bacterium]
MKPAAATSDNWIIEHVLAVQTLISLAYFGWLIANVDLSAPLDPQRLSPLIVLVGTLCTIAAVVFWVRMFRDFFRRRPERHAAAWGWFLLLAGHLAALFYFLWIWRPRNRPGQ